MNTKPDLPPGSIPGFRFKAGDLVRFSEGGMKALGRFVKQGEYKVLGHHHSSTPTTGYEAVRINTEPPNNVFEASYLEKIEPPQQ